jgi:hypothetical protein
MNTDVVYTEELTSTMTEILFVVLASVFLGLFTWRYLTVGMHPLAWVFLFFGLFFIFYSINYRRLVIRMTAQAVHLRFGIFGWTIPFENVQDSAPDEVTFTRLGGAGIHFAMVAGRYRANFNFLEHPRVLVRLKQKQGLVWDVSFSTRQPEAVMRLIEAGMVRSGR